MKKKTYFVCSAVIAICLMTWSLCRKSINVDTYGKELLLANIEALTDGDQPDTDGNNTKLDCSYTPVPQPCSMFVSADVAARLFGKKVVSGDTVVEIELTGAQECKGAGEMTCQPVRCIDLIKTYQSLF